MFAGPGWSKTQSGTRPTVNTDMKESQGPESGRYMLLGPRPANLTPPGRARCVLAWLLSGRVSDGWVFAAGYAILLPFFLAPLFATRLLPGLDLPFHIAAADLLSKVGDPSSPYAPYYDGGLRMAPYAAHFLALAMLGKVIGLLAAHKLIIVLYVAGLPLSAAWLLAACGRSRVPALLAFPLAYNLPLHYGFITFTLSLPVVLLLLAAMVKLAFVRGRDYVLPQDVLDMALDVMRHRLVLSYEALSDNVSGDDLLNRIIKRIPVPVVPLHEHANIRANA